VLENGLQSGVAFSARASKAHAHRSELAEEAPRQPRMIGEDDPLSEGNHGFYIGNPNNADNETESGNEKGA
jgi:hypothetical protein